MAGTETALKPRKISPSERAQNFARATRRYEQAGPTRSFAAGETVRIPLDKVRLSARIKLLVRTTLTAVHAASTTYTPGLLAPYSLIRNVRLNTNQSFAPWIATGGGSYLNMLTMGPDMPPVIVPVYGSGTPTAAQVRSWAYQGQQSSSGAGTANQVVFELDFPLAVNERDPIGLIMTQNQETNVVLELDLGDTTTLVASGLSGYTFTLGAITVTPLVETYSLPNIEDAVPDLTIIKSVGEETVPTTAGRFTYRCPVGATYRKLILQLTDGSGNPVDDTTLTGPFELTFNTSDVVTRYPAELLARRNAEMYGQALPRGVWVFDWTFQGLPNYGGSRDYIDTERLTEMWLTIQGPAAYNLRVVYETLSRMGG